MEFKDFLINFATRCFRDVADQDYIAARICYRNGLVTQFHWQALQAIEKYLKAILLFNCIKVKEIYHNLSYALELTENLPFELDLSETTLGLIKHLDKFGRYRYLEKSYYIVGPKLLELDKAVWEIRRYCKVLNWEKQLPTGKVFNGLDFEVGEIKKSWNQPFHKFKISGGKLEHIIQNRDHPSRAALIWQNACFGEKRRKEVTFRPLSVSEIAPLDLHKLKQKDFDKLKKYTHLPKPIIYDYEARIK